MHAQDVIAEIERQIAWLEQTGRRPCSIELGDKQFGVLARAFEAPSCESSSASMGYSALQVHGLPVSRSDSPSDVNVAATSPSADDSANSVR